LDNNIRDKGEYQITNALENMKNKGTRFFPGSVSEWLDCGNSDATVYTNTRYLSYLEGQNLMASDVVLEHSVVIQPSYVGKGVKITRSVVGPYASIGDGSQITDSRIKETIVLKNSSIKNSMISGSMVGNHTSVEGKMNKLSLGDYSTLAE
jgi:glucose-1-phosphate thymidylyltransferase